MTFHSVVPMAYVESVPRSIQFYGRLGFAVGHTHTPDKAAEPSWVWLQSGGAHLMLARASHPADAERRPVLFYLYCDDVAACRRELLESGVDAGPIAHPFYAPRGEFRVTDPDGYALMISHT